VEYLYLLVQEEDPYPLLVQVPEEYLVGLVEHYPVIHY
jgi:hypothetical protein